MIAQNTLASGLISIDLLGAITNNDLFGLICLSLLAVSSVISVMIIFWKYREIGVAKWQNSAFYRVMNRSGSWESLYLATKKYPESPMARLLRETYVECRMEKWFDQNKRLSMEGRMDMAHKVIDGVLARSISDEESRLQKYLWILSTVAALAPFIGLFGTVYGVTASFQAIGQEGSAALSSLAPGISTALTTTFFGLLAAIPALFSYNYFIAQIRQISNSLESFAHDVENAVRKQILTERGAPK